MSAAFGWAVAGGDEGEPAAAGLVAESVAESEAGLAAESAFAPGLAPELGAPLRALRDDVAAEFARLGGEAARWPDPHELPDGELVDPLEEEYSRVTDPEKYAILALRAEAWTHVLTDRGWASAQEVDGPDPDGWRTEPAVAPAGETVLRPHRTGAVALRLARTDVESGIRGLIIGVGEPAAQVALLPACGCDACDDGSDQLLEELDEAILAVVEGAFEVSWNGRVHEHRAADRGSRGGGDARELGEPFRIAAGPWADGWEPRPLIDLD